MSALGHKRTLAHVYFMSALPPKADIHRRGCDVRFVPEADIGPESCHRDVTARRSLRAVNRGCRRLRREGQKHVNYEEEAGGQRLNFLRKARRV
jgi:hypothetical protein